MFDGNRKFRRGPPQTEGRGQILMQVGAKRPTSTRLGYNAADFNPPAKRPAPHGGRIDFQPRNVHAARNDTTHNGRYISGGQGQRPWLNQGTIKRENIISGTGFQHANYNVNKNSYNQNRLKPLPPTVPLTAENEDDVENGNDLTVFNEICQKGVAGLRTIKWQYIPSQIPSRRVGRYVGPSKGVIWDCVGTTAARKPGLSAEEVTISKSVITKSQKGGRRLVAGLLLDALVEMKILTEKCRTTRASHINNARSQLCPNADGTGMLSSAETQEISDAVSVLNQLWQKDHFLCRPKRTETPVSTGATQRWKSTVLVKTKKYGDVECSSILSQKTRAYQMACLEVIKKLKATPLLTVISRINTKAKPQSHISSVLPGGNDTPRTMDKETKDRLNSEVENDGVVKPTGVEPVPVDEFESLLSAISEESVVVARSAADCSKWVSSNVVDGSQLGIYIDSRASRLAMLADANDSDVRCVDANSEELLLDECFGICLSTESSVLVVSSKFIVAPASKNKKKKNERKLEINTWIPKAIKFVLEREECRKYGVGLGEGLMLLRFCHGIKCLGVTELAIASTALLGNQASTKFQFPTVCDLVRSWVGCGIEPFLERAFSLQTIFLSSASTAAVDDSVEGSKVIDSNASTGLMGEGRVFANAGISAGISDVAMENGEAVLAKGEVGDCLSGMKNSNGSGDAASATVAVNGSGKLAARVVAATEFGAGEEGRRAELVSAEGAVEGSLTEENLDTSSDPDRGWAKVAVIDGGKLVTRFVEAGTEVGTWAEGRSGNLTSAEIAGAESRAGKNSYSSGNPDKKSEAAEKTETGNKTEVSLKTAVSDCFVPAVGIAVACSAIQKRLEETSETRRRKLYGQSEQHRELCNRLSLFFSGDF